MEAAAERNIYRKDISGTNIISWLESNGIGSMYSESGMNKAGELPLLVIITDRMGKPIGYAIVENGSPNIDYNKSNRYE